MCRSWLRHCATSRKVAGSIPDGVQGVGGVRLRACRADNLTAFMCLLS